MRSSRPPWDCDRGGRADIEGQQVTLGGRYRVEDELGRGGMAKVYRGQDTVLGRTVAIKVLAPQFADDPNFVTRFRREAQAAARLSNHNLVSVFDTGSDDGVHYIVMEFVEGKTLAQFLAGGGRIMPERAIDIAIDVTRALDAAHAQGVIHRDIKPGNIMLNERGDVKVTDFGIARVTTTETVAQTAAVLGTASYLSPEQAQGQPVDGRSDIYSLGCVLYEMVAGRPPFLGDSPVTVASKQVLEQPTPPSKLNRDVTPDLDAVILRALAKNPANRYDSAEAFRADLERVRRGLPVEATPLLAPAADLGTTRVIHHEPGQRTSVLPPTEYEPERSRWWIPVLVTLAILGVLALVLFLLAQSLLNDEDPGATLVAVPDVVGERRPAAERALEDAGLVVGEITPVPAPVDDPELVPGVVLEQNPPADEEVEEGTAVNLTVVEQPGLVLIPTGLIGQDPEAVRLILEDELGLVPSFVEEPSDEIDEGLVTGTDPPEGTEVEPGSPVTVFVSTGAEDVLVPQVTCRPFGAAVSELQRAGLNPVISETTVPINPLCPNANRVADQDPDASSTVPAGTTVTLFGGEEPVPTGGTGETGATGPTGEDDD